jgi:hypothetical protein
MIISNIFNNNFQKLPNLLKFCPNYLLIIIEPYKLLFKHKQQYN